MTAIAADRLKSFSPKMQRYVSALLDAGYHIHPKWNVQQIKGAAQNLVPDHAENLKAARAAAWERMRAGEGFLYLVQIVEHPEIVKIGYGLDLEKRMATLPRDCGFDVRLVRSAPGSFYAERKLHRRLWRLRWRGTHKREFYPANALYSSGVDLPQGFMIGLASILEAHDGS